MKPYPDIPPGLTREQDGAVLRLRFNRPERRNSLTDPIVYALTDTVDAAASDESVRVIHLEGEGEHFCSGFDLAGRTPGPERPRVGSVHRRMNGHVNRLIPAMLTCQTPIVCTARGWVIGLGLDILLATDFSKGSYHALPYAIALAEENHAELILLHAAPLVPWEQQSDMASYYQKRLEEMVPSGHQPSCKIDFAVRFDLAAPAILTMASDKHADLIVMGAYGHSRWREWIMGGTTREMLQASPVPLLMAH